MHSLEARVDAIAARLTAAGCVPRVSDHDTHVRIETEVPEQAPTEAWREFLAALDAADWWGIAIGSKRGRTAWAAVDKETPAAIEAARGRGNQL
ncbi:hypothetical protein GCM10018779_27770 [Streptomyces griseocarneus]|nr:hypothetical protein GCM10018779_27770 [Streptomyces griseocarneus]